MKQEKYTFPNRDGRTVSFIHINDNTIAVTGYNHELNMSIHGSTDNIQGIDPSGGPYLSIGTNLDDWIQDGFNRFITKIELAGNDTILLKVSYAKPGTLVELLASALKKAAKAHHETFKDLNGKDEDWPGWYANYIIENKLIESSNWGDIINTPSVH